uniref:Uncharacterized protein n=1 Tax=Anopheles quadriannulatus TaxID=34691 RepID=A0A182XRZ5_ANOQN
MVLLEPGEIGDSWLIERGCAMINHLPAKDDGILRPLLSTRWSITTNRARHSYSSPQSDGSGRAVFELHTTDYLLPPCRGGRRA